MKTQARRLELGACLILGLASPALGQTLYDNGPINGTVDAETINFGFIVGDTFTISTGNSTLTGLSFGAWLFPGDILESADVTVSQHFLEGTVYFNQVVNFTQSGCSSNQYGFNVCTETGSFNGPTLANGTYWVTLQNAVVNDGDPVYWDENSGVGCQSPGCPSLAAYNGEGSIGSEAFTILGSSSSGTGTVPEPGSLLLVAGGFVVTIGTLRRKLR